MYILPPVKTEERRFMNAKIIKTFDIYQILCVVHTKNAISDSIVRRVTDLTLK